MYVKGSCIKLLTLVFRYTQQPGAFRALHSHGHGHGHAHGHIHIHRHDHAHTSRMARLRKRVTVMVLDLGIAVHSVIIGMTLGVQSDGSTFTTLLVALSFHQFFEVCT